MDAGKNVGEVRRGEGREECICGESEDYLMLGMDLIFFPF